MFSIHLSAYASIYLSIYLSIYPGSTLGVSYLLKYLFIYLSTSTRPSIYSGSNPLEGIYLPICLSFYLSVYVCLSGGCEVDICLCIYLSICWRRSSVVNLSIYIPIHYTTGPVVLYVYIYLSIYLCTPTMGMLSEECI